MVFKMKGFPKQLGTSTYKKTIDPKIEDILESSDRPILKPTPITPRLPEKKLTEQERLQKEIDDLKKEQKLKIEKSIEDHLKKEQEEKAKEIEEQLKLNLEKEKQELEKAQKIQDEIDRKRALGEMTSEDMNKLYDIYHMLGGDPGVGPQEPIVGWQEGGQHTFPAKSRTPLGYKNKTFKYGI